LEFKKIYLLIVGSSGSKPQQRPSIISYAREVIAKIAAFR